MTALGDFSSGDVLTAADLNAIGTWTTFTPTARVGTNFITFTQTYGRYVVINNLAVVQFGFSGFSYSGGGSLVVTGFPSAVTIPVGPGGFTAARFGYASLWNGGLSIGYESSAYRVSASAVGFTGDGVGVWSNTVPFTLNTSSELYGTVIYEVA